MHRIRSRFDGLQWPRIRLLFRVWSTIAMSFNLFGGESASASHLHVLSNVLHLHLFAFDDQQVQIDRPYRSNTPGRHKCVHMDQNSA